MSNWRLVRLDDAARRGSGHTPSKQHPEYWGGSIKWVSLKDTFRLDRGLIQATTETITQAGLAHSSAVIHPAGSVVLLRDAGVGKSAILSSDMAVSQHFIAWTCGPKLENWFLYYILQARKPEFDRISNGSTIKTIGLDYFRQLKIPLPEISEQRQISRALISVDNFIRSLEILIAKKQAIKQGMMQQLLSGRTRLPSFTGIWRHTRLGEVLSVRHGKNQKSVESPAGKYPILASGGQIGWSKIPLYSKPSVLIGRKGTIDRPRYQSTPFWTVDTLFYTEITPHADPKYLYYSFLTVDWRSLNESSGVPSLNSRSIENVEILLPEIDEQRAIRSALDDAEQEIIVLETRLDKARATKQGMMQQLLSGRTRLPT